MKTNVAGFARIQNALNSCESSYLSERTEFLRIQLPIVVFFILPLALLHLLLFENEREPNVFVGYALLKMLENWFELFSSHNICGGDDPLL